MRRCSMSIVLSVAVLIATPSLFAQTDGTPAPIEQAIPMAANAHISAVTLYRGRAAITRTAILTLNPGVYDLHFTNLPEAIQPQTLQTREGGGKVNVLGMDFLQEAATAAQSPKIAELDAAIEELQKKIKQLDQQTALLKNQDEFINAVTVRAANDATKDGGIVKPAFTDGDSFVVSFIEQRLFSWASEMKSLSRNVIRSKSKSRMAPS